MSESFSLLFILHFCVYCLLVIVPYLQFVIQNLVLPTIVYAWSFWFTFAIVAWAVRKVTSLWTSPSNAYCGWLHCWLSSYFSTLAFCFFIDRWAILCLIWDGFLAWLMKSIWLYYFTANVFSGLVLWEIKLQGRVESSAAILHDFSQVIDDNFFLS